MHAMSAPFIFTCTFPNPQEVTSRFYLCRDNCNKIGCQWCFLNSKGELLSSSDQFCGYSDQCPRGTMKPVKKTKDEDTEGTNIGAIVGPIVALLVVAIVVVVVGIYVRRRKSSAKSPAPTEMKSQTVTAPIPRQGEVGI